MERSNTFRTLGTATLLGQRDAQSLFHGCRNESSLRSVQFCYIAEACKFKGKGRKKERNKQNKKEKKRKKKERKKERKKRKERRKKRKKEKKERKKRRKKGKEEVKLKQS